MIKIIFFILISITLFVRIGVSQVSAADQFSSEETERSKAYLGAKGVSAEGGKKYEFDRDAIAGGDRSNKAQNLQYPNNDDLNKRPSNGRVYSTDGKYSGQVNSNGRVYGRDGKYQGQTNGNGRVYGRDGKYQGQTNGNGRSYGRDGGFQLKRRK